MSRTPQPPAPKDDEPSEEYTRFERLTRALFRVDKRDVPKHQPAKRQPNSNRHEAE